MSVLIYITRYRFPLILQSLSFYVFWRLIFYFILLMILVIFVCPDIFLQGVLQLNIILDQKYRLRDLPNSRAHKYFKWFPIIIKEPLCCLCMFGWKYIITIDIKMLYFTSKMGNTYLWNVKIFLIHCQIKKKYFPWLFLETEIIKYIYMDHVHFWNWLNYLYIYVLIIFVSNVKFMICFCISTLKDVLIYKYISCFIITNIQHAQ
jgi:hypothetical protein